MEIVDIAVKDLVPYDKNPRRNDEAAVKVAESIKQFGFKIPLVVDRNNVVVCGHTRLKAAKKLKLKTVPCILADDLSEDQIKAFRLVDNRTAEIAEWDFALLEEELADVQLDMTAFDFDDLLAEEEAGSENSQTPVGAEREEESALPPPQNASSTYTHRIVTPVYEVTGDCPEVSSLVDKGKAEALLESIDQAQELPDDVREFLRIAAARHYVLHFDRIAEYYAHAPAHIQRLMEDSCLVIIDFNKAIEQGYIRMSERLAALASIDEQGATEEEDEAGE